MTGTKPLVIVTRKLPDAIETRMMELFDVRLNLDDEPFSPARMVEAVQTADVLVPTVSDRIDAGVLEHAGDQLRLIASFGTGVDHIDVAAARARGVTVTNTPGVLTEDTADMTMALILAVPRRLVAGERLMRAGQWRGWSPTSMLGNRIHGKRLGIVGMGRIGQAVARRARGFGLSIHYHNRRPVHARSKPNWRPPTGTISIKCWPAWTLFRSIVPIAQPISISPRRLALIQPHAYIVNTSRGEVIDENALVHALQNRDLAGAGLDVFEHEPQVNPKLLELQNVVLLPHMGSATIEGLIDMGEKVIINIRAFVDQHAPPDRVFDALI